MKVFGKPISLILLLILIVKSLAAADYYWAPGGSGGSAKVGGEGEWNSVYGLWWSGSEMLAAGGKGVDGASMPFGTSHEDADLYFNGKGGLVLKTDVAFFGSNARPNRSHTLHFAPESHYRFQSAEGGPGGVISSGTLAHITYDVAEGATLRFGGNGSQIALVCGSDVSAGPGLVFEGGGAISFESRTLVRNNSPSSRMTIRGGTTVCFRSDSIYTAMAGNFRLYPQDLSRIAVEEGTLNIDGGVLYSGYRAMASSLAGSDGRGFGVSVGAVEGGGPATLNMTDGYLVALGDPRSADGNLAFAGIGIGMGYLNKGGVVNLNGGKLLVSNIQAAVSKSGIAILNLDGIRIEVSTDEGLVDYKNASIDQLQTRLDGFISGFEDTDRSYVSIGRKGCIVDTSKISSEMIDPVATIQSVLRGDGGLTKEGHYGLRLKGHCTYSGGTVVNGGLLELAGPDAFLAGDVVVQSGASFGGDGVVAGNVRLRADASLELRPGFRVKGDVLCEGDVRFLIRAAEDVRTPRLSLRSLKRIGDASLQLELVGDPEKIGRLVEVVKSSDFALGDIEATLNGEPVALTSQAGVLVVAGTR